MKWLALVVGLGSVWWLLRQMGTKRQDDHVVSAEWRREQSYDRRGY